MPGRLIHATRFDLCGSRGLAVWLTAVYGGAILAAWGSALPAGVAAVFSVLAAAGFLRDLRRHALRTARDAVTWLEIGPKPGVGLAGGQVQALRLRARPFVHPWLVILPLEAAEGPRSVLIPADSLSARADHKALRRLLRQGGAS